MSWYFIAHLTVVTKANFTNDNFANIERNCTDKYISISHEKIYFVSYLV